MNRTLSPLLALPVLLAGCGDAPAPERALEDVVLASFHPLECFADRIAERAVPVQSILPPDADAAAWQPPRATLERLQSVRLVAVNGAGLEPWLDAAALPRSRVVNTARPLSPSWIEREATTHRHGPGGEHTHGGTDPHTWLDPANAMVQANALALAMEAAWPEHAEVFRANAAALDAELRGLAQAVDALAPRLERVALLAAHPAYDYLARRHGLTVTSFDLHPGEAPDAESLEAVARTLTTDRPSVMLWESEPGDAARAALAELGVESVVFDPGENPPAEDLERGLDYLAIQRENLARLERTLPR